MSYAKGDLISTQHLLLTLFLANLLCFVTSLPPKSITLDNTPWLCFPYKPVYIAEKVNRQAIKGSSSYIYSLDTMATTGNGVLITAGIDILGQKLNAIIGPLREFLGKA